LKEGEYLKRAAILLFHPSPENFITGSYIKIGYFQTDDELIFQDEIHGNLFEQIEKTIDMLFTKYISLCSVSKATATRDLSELEDKQLLMNKGTKGYSAVYVLYRTLYGDAIGGDWV
jgi:predicted HTH transcriptional regulator